MDEFEEDDEKEGYKMSRIMVSILLFIFAISVGFALGFYIGIATLVNLTEDLTDDMTVTIDFDEEVAMDYMVKFIQEEYGDLLAAAVLNKNLDVNMTDDEKISVLVEGFNLEEYDNPIRISDETKRLLEEAKTLAVQKDISQTQKDFVPPELIDKS